MVVHFSGCKFPQQSLGKFLLLVTTNIITSGNQRANANELQQGLVMPGVAGRWPRIRAGPGVLLGRHPVQCGAVCRRASSCAVVFPAPCTPYPVPRTRRRGSGCPLRGAVCGVRCAVCVVRCKADDNPFLKICKKGIDPAKTLWQQGRGASHNPNPNPTHDQKRICLNLCNALRAPLRCIGAPRSPRRAPRRGRRRRSGATAHRPVLNHNPNPNPNLP